MPRRWMILIAIAAFILLGCDVLQQAQSIASSLQSTPSDLLPTPLPVPPSTVIAPTTAGTGASVQIISPAQGARLSADQSVQVQVRATGGPFIEILLYADSAMVDRIVPEKDAQFSGTLTWKGATAGTHRLKVMVGDEKKNYAEAVVDVEVAGDKGAPPDTKSTPASSGKMQVQILKPAPGARFSPGQPIQVEIVATGGPFFRIELLADSTTVDQVMPGKVTQFSGTLTWKGPIIGRRRLTVRAWDENKNFAIADLDVEITSGSSTDPGSSSPAGNLQIGFLNLVDGANLQAQVADTGMPFVSVRIEANGNKQTAANLPRLVSLDADGIEVANAQNKNEAVPFRADLVWSPWHGNGKYTVVARTQASDQSKDVLQRITVNITGIPASATPPLAKIRQLYQQQFGLALTAPVLARFNAYNDPAYSRWVSTAYVGNKLYEINLWDTGRYESRSSAVNTPASWSYCRPTGRIRILVIFVDYHNTEITKEAALNSLKTTDAVNARYNQYATQLGLKAPILQIQTTGAYIASPPRPGELVTPAQIKSLTGLDPAQFDLLAQVDLDSAYTYSKRYSPGAGGMTLQGCTGAAPQTVNLWVESSLLRRLDIDVGGSLLDHEFAHAMGWQHHWPWGDGSGAAQVEWNVWNPVLPTLLLGWTDADGDGVVEILDPTPYGIKK